MFKFLDWYNTTVAMAVTVLTALFGQFWFLFALFLLFNVIDWLTGWYKARKATKESSKVGLKGLLKKVGYWAIVIIGFSMPLALMAIGDIIGLDLSFLEFIGWFVLASLMVNEIRSILENLVETGYNVPPILTKGLAVTEKLLNKGDETVEAKQRE
jgi:toxin secretion/phage lysis holin